LAKPEWGTKHTCPGCDTRFYDLKKEPIICPSCETKIVLQAPKPRRSATPQKEAAPVAAVVKAAPVTDETDLDEDVLEAVVLEIEDDDDDDDDDSLIEDTSDLDEDDGMGEVKDHIATDISDDL